MENLLQISVRKPTRQVLVGNVPIGNGNPISIQTMTTTLTHDVDATLRQTERCAEAGAQIVRVAVPEERDAKALRELVKRAPVPIVADIHFNYQYALAAVDAGVAKVRI
ncbi:flavodoxin-dependent (E)-4-hydroxy-3-methylbut-2-enyl-diphosphate synthase, partial [Candidatus Poribacteria bacterium]|nr:flavodoxin-dependent (E)-4-hydroxy-3-methylbut-2-enyl-diphosphate synthase [Candidatus Poribacteria bacterium]